MTQAKPPTEDSRAVADERLESWKEIAGYLRRGVRTVRRWEKEEGLPVHRQAHKKLGTVYAHRSELDAWRDSRRAILTGSRRVPSDADGRPPTRIMVAVLPFENLSGDADQDYVADGLTEEMIGQLGRFNPETLGVIARTTVMQYKRTTRTVRQIGDELSVDYVVEGSIRREADRVRVSAQLIHARDQAHRWSATYEQEVRSILVLQRELARDIGHEIRLTLAPRQQTTPSAMATVNPDAYHAHLKGRQFLYGFTPDSVRHSVDCFRRAIELDPTYAPAYASLAEAYEQLTVWVDEPPSRILPQALEAAEHALRLDPGLPEAYASLGLIHASYLWNWPDAERHFQRALELNPGCSPAHLWYAEFLAEMGRIDDALEVIARAEAHDPLSLSIPATRAFAFWMGRQFDEAIAQAQLVLQVDPDYPMALIRLGMASAAKGMHDDAERAFERTRHVAPGLLDSIALLGYANARNGRADEARKRLEELHRLAASRYVPAFLFATVHMALGDHDTAVGFIEKELDARGWYLLLIKHGPQFDPLRSHPGFQAILRAMHFP